MQEIKYYNDYISNEIKSYLLTNAKPVKGVDGLVEIGSGGGLETAQSLNFLCDLYKLLSSDLNVLLNKRMKDRSFIDERTKAYYQYNLDYKKDLHDGDYKTVIDDQDADGRIVIGPHSKNYHSSKAKNNIAPVPEFLQGPHITLFGPPDNAKMSINAMNAFHRKLKDEPAVIEEILKDSDITPKWGADDEDSKTPLREDLVSAGVNLTGCFNGTLSFKDLKRNKSYELAKTKRSLPIKRFPGLALPSTFLFLEGNPLPLHLYDFALHLFENWKRHESLVFYVPKLENEEEASYIKLMIDHAERMIKELHPEYILGSVRLLIVLENPRAIFRVNEIIDKLYPYFVGASLGWHDYLGSTARLFKEDGNYRIPVKADPDIVIKHIKASHELLADVVKKRGGISIGGMYGILPITPELDTPSFQVTIKGFIRDVITQLKRGLDGFWVAHPDFVRIGITLVNAYKTYENGDEKHLMTLVKSLLNEKHHKQVIDFIKNDDIASLSKDDPLYERSLLAADIKESSYIANNDPKEVRYNVFQSLQYLTDWLSGNGCVALPANLEGESVRVMDDLATAERSRWEVWHEIYHNRFSLEDFLVIAHEEYNFIRKNTFDKDKLIQVEWNERTQKWYPIALHLMIKLMTDHKPCEFATELLIPFTIESIRKSNDPFASLNQVDSKKYALREDVEKFNYYFESCGEKNFAIEMSKQLLLDDKKIQDVIYRFSKQEIINAASFHGNIGESKKTLDEVASKEQAEVLKEDEASRKVLQALGEEYREKFGVKFLISAKGRSAAEIKDQLQKRLNGSEESELDNARKALHEITSKRLMDSKKKLLKQKISKNLEKHKVNSASIAISSGLNCIESHVFGAETDVNTRFQLASLSKSFASVFAIQYFSQKDINLNSRVSDICEKFNINLVISDNGFDTPLQLKHLMSHTGLNMHYVFGFDINNEMPSIIELVNNSKKYGYDEIKIINDPGTKFKYSGAGFLILEFLICSIEKKSIEQVADPYIHSLGVKNFTFSPKNVKGHHYAKGHDDKNNPISGGRKMFPSFAAGAMGDAASVLQMLNELTLSFHNFNQANIIEHNHAVELLYGTNKGSLDFMGCLMGLGFFIIHAGPNKFAIHQGANDGFRGLYIYCFDGPDLGKGLCLLCNGDFNGVLFNSESAQAILKELNIPGIDFSKFDQTFSPESIASEEIVNYGYKKLLFDAFIETLPEKFKRTASKLQPLAKYNQVNDAKVLSVTNQKFARAENIFSNYLPEFDPELFGAQGKIMDSWESVRHNLDGVEKLIFRTEKKVRPKFVSVSTKFHDGNQVEYFALFGKGLNDEYEEIIPKTQMLAHSNIHLLTTIDSTYQEFKLCTFPDGGLTRLAIYDESLPTKYHEQFEAINVAKAQRYEDKVPMALKPLHIDYKANKDEIGKNWKLPKPGELVDIACSAFGGEIESVTNEHYAPAGQVISPYIALNMFDGLESARSRKIDNFEEVIIKLGKKGVIKSIELDFTYFVNNNPLFISLWGYDGDAWINLISKKEVKAYAGNKYIFTIESKDEFERVKLHTLPDGGLNRIKVWVKV